MSNTTCFLVQDKLGWFLTMLHISRFYVLQLPLEVWVSRVLISDSTGRNLDKANIYNSQGSWTASPSASRAPLIPEFAKYYLFIVDVFLPIYYIYIYIYVMLHIYIYIYNLAISCHCPCFFWVCKSTLLHLSSSDQSNKTGAESISSCWMAGQEDQPNVLNMF